MRVFCPEHKKGFFAPRQNPVKCENRGHVLGEIDFEGQANSPVEIQWQYCCNCEHFCPVVFDQYGLQRCSVCTRKSSLLYLCDGCHVISFESTTPLQTKNFTLTADGAPQPSCPGCLRPAPADLYEHSCDELSVTFITGLGSCPVCNERLDVAPVFPSPVAQYLKRTRSTNKHNVTFDYETGSFVPVDDGEFVIVTGADPAIVLPRTSKFSDSRDFYEFYQDYYHCSNPSVGEVLIIHPATVVSTPQGWMLEATGMLDVVEEQSKQKPVAQVVEPPVAKREERAPVVARRKEEPQAKVCPGCGSMIEARYAFCWKCGSALNQKSKQSAKGDKSGALLSSAADEIEDDELTLQSESRPHGSMPFAWTRARTSDESGSSRGSVFKLIAIATIALLFLSLGVYGLFRSETQTASATTTPPVAENTQPDSNAAITTEVSRDAPAETTTQQLVGPEDELRKLRDQRLRATASERAKILRAFATVERKYPRDYRFPYERAKLTARATRASSRSAAFKALNVAAQKAISTGKANEMLSGLESDKSGDFSELAQGRNEWTRLVAALKRKDTSLLE
jgi:hypothetical protein